MGSLKYFIFYLLIILSNNVFAKKQNINIVFAAEMPEITRGHGYYPELATLLKQQRALSDNSYFYFGGGSLGPSILSSLDHGSHIIDLLNSLEPDAMGVSKREFSFSSANLSLRAFDAIFPIVATNIIEYKTGTPLDSTVKSAISYQGETKLGFLSVIDEYVIEAYTINEISLTSLKTSITRAAKKLREQGVDAIILHYTGYHPEINDLLDTGIIDLSIHKDEFYQINKNKSYHERDVFIKRPQDVAVISLLHDSSQKQPIVTMEWKTIDISIFPKDRNITIQTQGYIDRLNDVLSIKIGSVGNNLTTKRNDVRNNENIFGNYIADSIKEFSDADLALINSGLIRGDSTYSKGQILTRGTITSELPYRNYVVLIDLTGQQLLDSLENSLSLLETNNGRFPQVSGFKMTYNRLSLPGQRVKSVTINDNEINLDKIYRIATTDYLAHGGDGFEAFKSASIISDKTLATRLISNIVTDKIIKDKIVNGALEGRIIDLSKGI